MPCRCIASDRGKTTAFIGTLPEMFYTHLSPPCRPGLPSFGRALNNCNLIFAGQPLKLFARLRDPRTIISTLFPNCIVSVGSNAQP
jgi:hypothetical protein